MTPALLLYMFQQGWETGNYPALMHVKDKLTESMDLLIWVLGF